MNKNNSVWNFLASVKLALLILVLLSITSIIGTLIPQHKPFEWYVNFYHSIGLGSVDTAQQLAMLGQVLDLPDMYNSWWYRGLLAMLSINLTVCSIERFPFAWKIINAPLTKFSKAQLGKMKFSHSFQVKGLSNAGIKTKIEQTLSSSRLKTSSANTFAPLITGHSGSYSRLGVYIVHASILVIFAGGVVSSIFGFKGSIMIPELRQTGVIFAEETGTPIELGFEIRCDHFSVDYYESGMQKEYTTLLTVTEGGQDISTNKIEVNSPLTYKGVTFYQATYEPYQEFLIHITEPASQSATILPAPYRSPVKWEQHDLTVGVLKVETQGQKLEKIKLWISDGKTPAVEQWVVPGAAKSFDFAGKSFNISAKQRFATGLQVSKDPGVWLVYLGCFLMIAGLYLAFFISHKRIWVVINKVNEKEHEISVYGNVNKNQTGFSTYFENLNQKIEKEFH